MIQQCFLFLQDLATDSSSLVPNSEIVLVLFLQIMCMPNLLCFQCLRGMGSTSNIWFVSLFLFQIFVVLDSRLCFLVCFWGVLLGVVWVVQPL